MVVVQVPRVSMVPCEYLCLGRRLPWVLMFILVPLVLLPPIVAMVLVPPLYPVLILVQILQLEKPMIAVVD